VKPSVAARQAPSGCYCDESCTGFGDCCLDFLTYCAACAKDCPVGRYNQNCDNTIGFRNCQPCTTRPSASHYYTTDGDLTDSCQYESCVDSCNSGEFLDACGDDVGAAVGNNPGACSDCTNKPMPDVVSVQTNTRCASE
jgi:hypothetical protein